MGFVLIHSLRHLQLLAKILSEYYSNNVGKQLCVCFIFFPFKVVYQNEV